LAFLPSNVSVKFSEKKLLFTGYDGNDDYITFIVIAIIALIASEFIHYYKSHSNNLIITFQFAGCDLRVCHFPFSILHFPFFILN